MTKSPFSLPPEVRGWEQVVPNTKIPLRKRTLFAFLPSNDGYMDAGAADAYLAQDDLIIRGRLFAIIGKFTIREYATTTKGFINEEAG